MGTYAWNHLEHSRTEHREAVWSGYSTHGDAVVSTMVTMVNMVTMLQSYFYGLYTSRSTQHREAVAIQSISQLINQPQLIYPQLLHDQELSMEYLHIRCNKELWHISALTCLLQDVIKGGWSAENSKMAQYLVRYWMKMADSRKQWKVSRRKRGGNLY